MSLSRVRVPGHFFAFAFLFSAAGAHAATVIDYPDFNFTCGTNGLTCAGDTATTGGQLQITAASGNQAGAAYSTSAVTLGANDTFSTVFDFQFTNAGGVDPADGITLVFATNPSGLGDGGNEIGYGGDTTGNSVAIEFDTYDNGNENSLGFFPDEPDSSNHVAIDENGVLSDTDPVNVYGNPSCGFSNGTPVQNSNTAAGCMSNGDIWTVTLGYDGSTNQLTLLLSDPAEGYTFTAYNGLSIDLASVLGTNTIYAGFTGSTGEGWEQQNILNWTLDNTTDLVGTPEPGTLLLVGLGALAILFFARQNRNQGRSSRS